MPEFNKNAAPFVPSGVKEDPTPSYSALYVSNIPPYVSVADLQALINKFECHKECTIAKFTPGSAEIVVHYNIRSKLADGLRKQGYSILSHPPWPPYPIMYPYFPANSLDYPQITPENSPTPPSNDPSSFPDRPVPQNVPPFVMNMLQKNDEKYNPCRLFIGNVPYTSTWSSLKQFLISKAKEIDPSANLSILRVEIPTHQLELLSGGYSRSKSRGFAIVTTGNKETSAKLIEMFDNTEFEGRSLTVRYDRFPDFPREFEEPRFPMFSPCLVPMYNYPLFPQKEKEGRREG